MLNEASNESVRIFDRGTSRDCRRPSTTSTSKKPLTGDTGNARQLYASSISEIQVADKKEMVEEGKIIHADSSVNNVCTEGEFNGDSGEICYSLLLSI